MKHTFRAVAAEGDAFRLVTKKSLVPGDEEIRSNPRARSARLMQQLVEKPIHILRCELVDNIDKILRHGVPETKSTDIFSHDALKKSFTEHIFQCPQHQSRFFIGIIAVGSIIDILP